MRRSPMLHRGQTKEACFYVRDVKDRGTPTIFVTRTRTTFGRAEVVFIEPSPRATSLRISICLITDSS
jgi:hypothetical protein